MSRDYFKHLTDGSPRVRGTIISDVQGTLNALTTSSIDVDGDFGKQTEDALRVFQTAHGLPVTGTVSDTTWTALMHNTEPPIFERCLQVVGSFEGTGFTKVEGNFDGAGLTWGVIGFTLKNGEISNLLGAIAGKFPTLLSQAFGNDAATLMKNIGPDTTLEQRMAFATSVSGPGFQVVEPWASGFATLGKQPAIQRLQVERARDAYWTAIALRDARDLGLSEELDLLLMLDVAVQNGGMRSNDRLEMAKARLLGGMSPTDKRRVIAEVVASTVAEKWQHDVLERKTCVADGQGIVHRDKYSLVNWGLAPGFVPQAA